MALKTVLTPALVVSALMALVSPALAISKQTKMGKPVVLAASYGCERTIAPTFFVTTPPTNGTTDIRNDKPRPGAVCKNNGRPILAVRLLVYTPRPGFKGTDTVHIHWDGSRGSEYYSFEVTVE